MNALELFWFVIGYGCSGVIMYAIASMTVFIKTKEHEHK